MANDFATNLPRFAVELTLVGRTRAQLAEAIAAVTHGAVCESVERTSEISDLGGRRYFIISPQHADPRRVDLTTPMLGGADMGTLQQVLRAVRACGVRAVALAVHLDGERFDERALRSLRRIVEKRSALLCSALGVTGERAARVLGMQDTRMTRRIEKRVRAVDEERLRQCRLAVSLTDEQQRAPAVDLVSLIQRGTIAPHLFEPTLHSGAVRAYVDLARAIAARALVARATSNTPTPFDPSTARYDFRVFLLHLQLSGEAFRTTREQLLRRLEGSAAWKHGPPAKRTAA